MIEKNKIAIKSQVKLYSQPRRVKENEIGKSSATNMEFETIAQHTDTEHITWYKIRVIGFVKK